MVVVDVTVKQHGYMSSLCHIFFPSAGGSFPKKFYSCAWQSQATTHCMEKTPFWKGWVGLKSRSGPLGALQGPVSISDKTSYHKISQVPKPRHFYLERSLWNLKGTSRCPSNFKVMQLFKLLISPGFQASRDLVVRRLIGYWNMTQISTRYSSSATKWGCS